MIIYIILGFIVVIVGSISFSYWKTFRKCKKEYGRLQEICNQLIEFFDSLNMVLDSTNAEYSRLVARTRKVWRDAETLEELYFAAHLLEGALEAGLTMTEYSGSDPEKINELKQEIKSTKRKFLYQLQKFNELSEEYYKFYGKVIPLKFLPESHILPPKKELWEQKARIGSDLLTRTEFR